MLKAMVLLPTFRLRFLHKAKLYLLLFLLLHLSSPLFAQLLPLLLRQHDGYGGERPGLGRRLEGYGVLHKVRHILVLQVHLNVAVEVGIAGRG